ncbi:MAG: AMP-binding protein [Oribacterium sp.]|nr:AMP-binding protein [Oribacterium sp.]
MRRKDEVMQRLWNFEKFGTKPAIIDDKGDSLSYRELGEFCKDIASLSLNRSLFMMFCENTIGALSCYYSFLNNGFPLMLLSSGLSSEAKDNLMKIYHPGFMILPEKQRNEYPFMKEVWRVKDYVVLKTNYDKLYPVYSDLALLLSTSGSTGSVKFVRQTFENTIFNAKTLSEMLGMTSDERTVTSLPMYYTYGLSFINTTFLIGATMMVTKRSFMEEDFWDFVEDQKVTAFNGVANAYDMLMRIGIFEEEFPNLKLMTQAGNKLSNEIQKYLGDYADKYGKKFVVIYGLCETTCHIAYLPSENCLEKPGSVGIPIPGGKIYLADDEGNEINEPDRDGQVIYEGPNVTMGYALSGEDLCKDDEWHGKVQTGDMARRDSDGYYHITGRIKRYIKIAGNRISLDEIDENIMKALHIFSVSSGTDDDLVVFVNGEDEKTAVSQFVKKALPVARTCLRVKQIDEFPRNEAGKIMYGELKKLL